jgi:signal transduction histidine kinase
VKPLSFSPSVRVLATALIVGIWIAVLVMAWVGYRATREWRRSSELLLERRTDQAANVLFRAVLRDMRAIEDLVLRRLHWTEVGVSEPHKLGPLVASAFARYPYPEAFFGWSRQVGGPAVFFLRADRRPHWIEHNMAGGFQFPVTPVRDAAATIQLLPQLESSAAAGHEFTAFQIQPEDVPYQVIARLMYRDERRDFLEAVFGFIVNMEWVRESYFPEIVSQGAQVAGVESGLTIALRDEDGKLLASAPPEGAGTQPSGGFRVQRQFQPLFLDPLLIASNIDEEVLPPIWSIEVTASTEPTPIPADGRTLAVTTVASLAFGVGLLLTARAVRVTADLAKVRSDFVASVTHELKTPLSTIRGVGEALVSGRVSTTEKVHAYGEMLDQEAKRLTRLVDNLLAYSRVTDVGEVYSFEPLSAADLIDDALHGFEPQFARKGFDVCVDMPLDLPTVRADRTAMSLVLDNLIDNALRYAPSGRWLGVRAWHAGTLVHIAISDRGDGIPPDEIDRVVQRFVRGRQAPSGGSGLGLAIVKRLVNDHGGDLSVRSEAGKGTDVEVTLPAMDI